MALSKAKQLWEPGALFQWLKVDKISGTCVKLILPESSRFLSLDFGFSIHFLKNTRHVLAAVYTAGSKLEAESVKAYSNKNFLLAYAYDVIGQIVLEKVCKVITGICEKRAADLAWGTSPFLSPGSVPGWKIEEQEKICSIFPLEKINIKLLDSYSLSPLKTISCLIGIGEGYESSKVGVTCQVCSKKDSCEMKTD